MLNRYYRDFSIVDIIHLENEKSENLLLKHVLIVKCYKLSITYNLELRNSIYLQRRISLVHLVFVAVAEGPLLVL